MGCNSIIRTSYNDTSRSRKIGKLLELDEEVVQALTVVPLRGQIMEMPPTDPIAYRLYEMMLQYAPTIRELILEKAGEGVMSAINFNLGVDTQEDPKGGLSSYRDYT